MQIKEINNLVELFFLQYKNQNKKNFFLHSLKEKTQKYTWENSYVNTIKLSNESTVYMRVIM